MVQTKSSKLTSNVGQEIGLELGAQMISSYRIANPTDVTFYYVGRNILEQVLAQPGCVGIKFYNAYNEAGEKTLVYIGINNEGQNMLKLMSINVNGQLETTNGIVADRIRTGTGVGGEDNWWDFSA